ncbi:MAG: hypothetical protein WCE68_17860 [Anaerolineales bacterium]
MIRFHFSFHTPKTGTGQKGLTVGLLILALAIGALAPISGLSTGSVLAAPGVTLISHPNHFHKPVCPHTNKAGTAYCDAEVVTDATGNGISSMDLLPGGYGPWEFRGAYGVSGITSTTRTVAIVDAYDDPTVLSDLNTYSTHFGIPTMNECPVSSGTAASPCFQEVDENGGTNFPPPDNDWDGEISLDVQVVHAMCQNCNILLVEAASDEDYDLIEVADQTAVSMGANVVSNSWGEYDFDGETSYDSYFNHPGVPFVFSSGDTGDEVEYPAASPNVTAVGGTSLYVNSDDTYNSETAWSGAGSGCSAYESKPGFQHDPGCPTRTVADVSADADPDTGALIYINDYPYQYGGTSLAAPLIASIYALAGGVGSTLGNSLPYANVDYGVNMHDVTSGSNGSCGSYLCTAGAGYDGPTGLGTPLGLAAFTISTPTMISAISAGGDRTCALTAGGGVKCWGYNGDGQLGDGKTADRHTPVNVNGLAGGVSAIAAGGNHTCALTTSGGVKCWGYNGYGQLGDGTTTDRHTPVNVVGLASGVSAISAGGNHTCALTTGGGVKCWGYNGYGQLGDGTTTNRHTPVNVIGLTGGVSAIAAGGDHTCALTTGGAVQCWGWNHLGQLGDGTTTNRHTPVNVAGLTGGVSTIAAGADHTCALTTEGGVKCWGYNGYGQLGDGTTTDRHTPVNVAGLISGVSAIVAGGDHTCALTTGGAVQCWGRNHSGQLGDGTTTNRHRPVNGLGLSGGVSAIAAGGDHTCALTTEGYVKCWGYNNSGQVGDGTTTNRRTPVYVVGMKPAQTGN